MKTRQHILQALIASGGNNGTELARMLGITRQAINAHLRKLISEGLVRKEGQTRGARYFISDGKKQRNILPHFSRRYSLRGLEEDRVFEETALFLNLRKLTSPTAFEILQYAFTEMLNNSIDHSESSSAMVEVSLDSYDCTFRIRDHGIGVFHSIASKYNLADETQAVAELLKGKTTTMRKKHSGEGIFFTSKAGDQFTLRSHETELMINNTIDETYVARARTIKGTEVRFKVKRRARRKLANVFSIYAPEEFSFQFERTRVLVRLFRETYVSRSEAKRLLVGLDQFKEIILDFKGVQSIGQGFSDEVFRIFQSAHPDISFRIENLDPVLRSVIEHGIDNNI